VGLMDGAYDPMIADHVRTWNTPAAQRDRDSAATATAAAAAAASQQAAGRRTEDAILLSALVVDQTLKQNHQQAMAQQKRQFDWGNHVQLLMSYGASVAEAQAMATAHFADMDARRAAYESARVTPGQVIGFVLLPMLIGLWIAVANFGGGHPVWGVVGVGLALFGLVMLKGLPQALRNAEAAKARMVQPTAAQVPPHRPTPLEVPRTTTPSPSNPPVARLPVVSPSTAPNSSQTTLTAADYPQAQCQRCGASYPTATITPVRDADGNWRGIGHCTACGQHDEDIR
jgi:hypothetical protein